MSDAPIRVPVELQPGTYQRLAVIARGRGAVPRDSDTAVADVIVWFIGSSLAETDRRAAEREQREREAARLAATTAPWRTGAWSQDEIDVAVAAAQAGRRIHVIASLVRRRRGDVAELLRGFGLEPAQGARRTA